MMTHRIKKHGEDGYALTWCGRRIFLSNTPGRPERADDEECAECSKAKAAARESEPS